MRKVFLILTTLFSLSLKAQPFPETQVAEFSPFIKESIVSLEAKKHQSLALVLKNTDASIAEILLYQLTSSGSLSLTHATMDVSSHKLFFDSYEYKKIGSEYFLIKRDTTQLKCKFQESKEQGKTKLNVSNFEWYNCRTDADTSENRTYFFDEKNRLERISNAKRVLYTASYPTENQVNSTSLKQRCTSCGNGNEAAVVSFDSITTKSTFIKQAFVDNAYDCSITQNTTTKFMNCDWDSESSKSTITSYHVIQDSNSEMKSVRIESTELHENELNLTSGASSSLFLFFGDAMISDTEEYIEQLISK